MANLVAKISQCSGLFGQLESLNLYPVTTDLDVAVLDEDKRTATSCAKKDQRGRARSIESLIICYRLWARTTKLAKLDAIPSKICVIRDSCFMLGRNLTTIADSLGDRKLRLVAWRSVLQLSANEIHSSTTYPPRRPRRQS